MENEMKEQGDEIVAPSQEASTPPQVQQSEPVTNSSVSSLEKVRKATAQVLIITGVLFAIIGILSIWGVISDGNVAWKSLTTLGVVALAALTINVGMKIYEDKVK